MWQIPESELRVLGEVAGRDILELGCGAAQWSIALADPHLWVPETARLLGGAFLTGVPLLYRASGRAARRQAGEGPAVGDATVVV